MNFLTMFLRGLTLLPSVIQSVEALLGAKTGTQKKDAALSVVQSAINVTDAVAKKTIADSAAFNNGLGAVIDGVVACLNASVWHTGATTPATTSAPAAPAAS